jgi:2-dehydro-3-deoxyphosphogluconate aldolase/(4S)-4-hydroxy-2-oxoglutarate aldolase
MHTNKTEHIINVIKEQGIIPLFYHDNAAICILIIDALYNAGIRVVEYTNRGGSALENFKQLVAVRNSKWTELILCAGTVKTADAAKQFMLAGADFIVCPCMIPDVAKAVHAGGLMWVPGCMTSTEIAIAEQNGAVLVKLFPGSLLGPSYVNAVKEIFPGLMFMPTGGVDVSAENLSAWFKSGVVAVGLGSKVISKELVKSEEYEAIGTLAKRGLEIVKAVKTSHT